MSYDWASSPRILSVYEVLLMFDISCMVALLEAVVVAVTVKVALVSVVRVTMVK